MKFGYEEFDLSGVRTYPLDGRGSKAKAVDFAKPFKAGSGVSGLIDSMPSILAGADFKAIVAALGAARTGGHGIIWGLGAHVVKTGLSPIIVDLMERGFVSAIATNGAGVIHDFEVAIAGSTSEDVDEALGPGRFGMAEETGRLLNAAINAGVAEGLGLGESVARYLHAERPRHANISIVASAARLEIPVTVHVAIGTDIIHMHPHASGAAIGEGSLRDFRYFVSNVARLERRLAVRDRLLHGGDPHRPDSDPRAVCAGDVARRPAVGAGSVNRSRQVPPDPHGRSRYRPDPVSQAGSVSAAASRGIRIS